MSRINLQKMKEDEECRNRDYVWKKPLVIGNRTIKSSKDKKNERRNNGKNRC